MVLKQWAHASLMLPVVARLLHRGNFVGAIAAASLAFPVLSGPVTEVLGAAKAGGKALARPTAERGALTAAERRFVEGQAARGLAVREGGVVVVSENNAKVALANLAEDALRQRPTLLTVENVPELFSRYPTLAATKRYGLSSDKYKLFLEQHPTFRDDAAVALYRFDPGLFRELGEPTLNDLVTQIKPVVHSAVTRANSQKVQELLEGLHQSLRQKGFSEAEIRSMDDTALQKILDKALGQEIDGLMKDKTARWSYKSGSLTVKGAIGHFDFEQAFDLIAIAKWMKALLNMSVTATVGVAGVVVVANSDMFEQVRDCVRSLCLLKVRYAEQTGRQIGNGTVK